MTTYGPYPAVVTDWHDGDTAHLNISLGFSMFASFLLVPQLAAPWLSHSSRGSVPVAAATQMPKLPGAVQV